MRRLLGAACLALAMFPAWAGAAPAVGKLVDGAIDAVKTKSYEARLRFLSQSDGVTEQAVHMYHVAPELYRVEPLSNGLPGSTYYIENSVELVKLSDRERPQPIPSRQYYATDMLTIQFLRDIGTHQGTSLLDGEYNGVPVYYLRQDVTPGKPYLITVGLRRDNKFPMFLQVVDDQGRTRVHYEFESIKFVPASSLQDELFTIPEPKEARRTPSSHLAPGGDSLVAGRSGGKTAAAIQLPLFPAWLPEGYQLDAISVLDYNRGQAGPALVYHFEIYGPTTDDMLSVFQMRAGDMGASGLSQALAPQEGGYLLQQHGDWVVAVFGGVSRPEMQRVIDSLDNGQRDKVLQLINQTRLRDQMLEQAIEAR